MGPSRRLPIEGYATFGNRRAYISYPPQMPQELSDWFQPFHKTGHIYKLYLHYCYLLGYLPKHTDYKPTGPYLKEDLRKPDELSEQVRYMGKYGIYRRYGKPENHTADLQKQEASAVTKRAQSHY